jgi:hypothetical protein
MSGPKPRSACDPKLVFMGGPKPVFVFVSGPEIGFYEPRAEVREAVAEQPYRISKRSAVLCSARAKTPPPPQRARNTQLRTYGFDFAHSPPPATTKSPDWLFGAAGCLRKIWALTEKARGGVYCTGLRASWSELAYFRPLRASETEPF